MPTRPIPATQAEAEEMARTRTYKGEPVCGCGNYATSASGHCTTCANACEVCSDRRATTERNGDKMCADCARQYG
jgi:hypothetical protein